jgi:murein peptide amidase A
VTRAHDYRHLLQRWRALARRAGLRMQRLATDGDYETFTLRTDALAAEGGIYISAGIHGDEAAATEALITWAEQNAARLRRMPLLLFPCLNPWGLVNNSRYDQQGRDLNRLFHTDEAPVVAAVRRLVRGHRFALALQLHEDYDGQGFYLYEVQRARPYWGEALLAVAARHIPIEPRNRVDGRVFHGGLMRRRVERRRFAAMGYPEAIWLHLEHADRTFTIETPSEFALADRVRAQVAVIDAAVRMAVNAPACGASEKGRP